jgi:HSP20 family protein
MMTMVKVNNIPALRNWNGVVNELFSELEKSLVPAVPQSKGVPAVNIAENNEGFHLELLAAGRKKDGFSLGVENNQLTLTYNEEKQETPADVKQIRREFSVGNFKRTFNLDDTIDADKIQAKYEDGILKVFLPKKAELKPLTRIVEIQ